MTDFARCHARVESVLMQVLGGLPGSDPTGGWYVAQGPTTVMVKVVQMDGSAPPLAVVATTLLTQISKSPQLLDVVNSLNGQVSFARIYWLNGFVFASTELIAETLDPAELGAAVSQIASIGVTYGDGLRAQFSGTPAYGAGVPVSKPRQSEVPWFPPSSGFGFDADGLVVSAADEPPSHAGAARPEPSVPLPGPPPAGEPSGPVGS